MDDFPELHLDRPLWMRGREQGVMQRQRRKSKQRYLERKKTDTPPKTSTEPTHVGLDDFAIERMIFVFHVNFWGSRYSCGAHVNMSFYTMNDLCRTLYVCTGPISMMRREGPCVVGPERCHQNNRIQRKKKHATSFSKQHLP